MTRCLRPKIPRAWCLKLTTMVINNLWGCNFRGCDKGHVEIIYTNERHIRMSWKAIVRVTTADKRAKIWQSVRVCIWNTKIPLAPIWPIAHFVLLPQRTWFPKPKLWWYQPQYVRTAWPKIIFSQKFLNNYTVIFNAR